MLNKDQTKQMNQREKKLYIYVSVINIFIIKGMSRDMSQSKINNK